jgi:hypothetical protein
MLSEDEKENKPIGKPGQRKVKGERKAEQSGKKGEPRKRKEGQPALKPDQLLEALERASAPIEVQVSEPIAEPMSAPPPEPMSSPIPEPVSEPVLSAESSATEALPAEPPAAVPVGTTPVSLQTIANAFGDYSKRSFEQTSSFVEKLAGARSLASAIELQVAFAREAYETFVAESKKIRELQGELAKQRLARLEGFVTQMTQSALHSTRRS